MKNLFEFLSGSSRRLLTAMCLMAAGWASPGFAAPSALETLLSSAASNNGMIKEAAADVEAARSQLQRANAALFPHASVTVVGAPLWEERGNATGSTTNFNNWGPFIKGGFEVIQPLYTFGQIGSYQKAAENQIVAKQNLTAVKQDEIVLMAKEFFYGYRMATDLDALLNDLIQFLSEAVTKAESSMKDEDSGGEGVKPHDLFKLKTALEDLKQKKLQAEAARKTAERALAWVSQGAMPELPKDLMAPEPFEKKSLEEYIALAKANRPEFRALAAGKEARAALRDAKRAQSYPVLFVGALGSMGWSPVRDRQTTIYAYDPFNRFEGGAGVGFKLDLEFARHAAEAAEQEAELNKLRAVESYAAPGIELQVKKAFWELEQAMSGLQIAESRRALAKKWFVSNGMGWSIGVTSPKDVLESLEGNGLARKNLVETIYAVNMALAKLSQATGIEVTSLRYARPPAP